MPEFGSEWANMLRHQLPELPPVAVFTEALRVVFDWLRERAVIGPALRPAMVPDDVEDAWSPPPTITTWGTAAPLEAIRFAAANRLCVDLGYQGSMRRVEPYSLRRTRDGDLTLSAIRRDTRDDRSYRVDRIASVRVTNEPFVPPPPRGVLADRGDRRNVADAAPVVSRFLGCQPQTTTPYEIFHPRLLVNC